MKTLRDIISSVKKTHENAVHIDLEILFFDAFHFELSHNSFSRDSQIVIKNRFKGYKTEVSWYESGSWIGIEAYYLDDELVFVTYQIGVTYGKNINWVSHIAYEKMRDFILSNAKTKITTYEVADMNHDLKDWISNIK